MNEQMKSGVGVIIRKTGYADIAAVRKQGAGRATKRAVVCTGAAAALLGLACWNNAEAGGLFPVPRGTFIFAPSEPAAGVAPNALPFAETFDRYPTDFHFDPPTNGWLKAAWDYSSTVPVAGLPVTPAWPSLFSGNCLKLETEGETFCNATTGSAKIVWIDLSALLFPSEEMPVAAPGTQFGMLLDWDKRITVYCGLPGGFVTSGIRLDPDAGQTVRLTLQVTYADSLPVPYFRVFADQAAVFWGEGYRLPGVPSAGGEWLPCAGTSRSFNGLCFQGVGYVDTLTFSDAYLGTAALPQAGIAQAVAVSWLTDYGRSYQVEACDDLEGGEWRPFGAPVLGDGTTNTVFDAVGSVSQKFYRVTPL